MPTLKHGSNDEGLCVFEMMVLGGSKSYGLLRFASLGVFSLRQEHVWTCSVLGDHICETKRMTAGDQNLR